MSPGNVRRRASRPAVAAVVVLAACTGGRDAGGAILVAAASDLAAALPELIAAFETAHGAAVEATIGSSGQLAQQILQGAPVDVFLSADAGWVDVLETAGRTEPATRGVYAYGRLVLLAGRVAEPPASAADLAQPVHARIALANPEHAPYGRAAQQVLVNVGVHDRVADRLVPVENVRNAVQLAETGAVEVAIAALSLMDSTRHRWHVVPAELHEPLAQTAVVIANASDPGNAAAFVDFVLGPAGREILLRYGFVLP